MPMGMGPSLHMNLERVCLVSMTMWAKWGWIYFFFAGVSKTCSLGGKGDFVCELSLTSSLQQLSYF